MWAERLTFDLHADLVLERWPGQGNTYPIRLSDLGFAPAHPRYWGSLPSDDQLSQNVCSCSFASWRDVVVARKS